LAAKKATSAVTLDLDPSFLDGAAHPARLLNLLGQPFLLRLTDADEGADDSDCLAAAARGLTPYFDSATIASRRLGRWLTGMWVIHFQVLTVMFDWHPV
jgi:hypothetical protein